MLQDSFLRSHNYLRVSITDKCNLRCRYCIPPQGVELLSHGEVLRNEEFVRLMGVFISLGIDKIRFTGGEPLVRKGFLNIVSETRKSFPGVELCLTTNGLLLERVMDDLRRLEVRKINISLDTVSPGRYRDLTGSNSLEKVMMNIDALLAYRFFELKVNAVLFKETLGELERYLDHFSGRDLTLRFIEKMPFTDDSAGMTFITADTFIKALEKMGELRRDNHSDTRVARMYALRYRDRPMRIGVIPPLSHSFCANCNRIRITSDGRLKTCLHSDADTDLKSLLRQGADDDMLREAVKTAVTQKHSGHDLECYPDDGACSSVIRKGSMSKIGG